MRQIRTAGKGSGSVELTLPGALRGLVGLPCRIVLHDGEQPDIVLQPGLEAARAAFAMIWRHLALVLLGEPAPVFESASFRFTLLEAESPVCVPALCWQDGIELAGLGAGRAATGRVAAAMAEALAPELGIAPAMKSGFGAVCGYLAAGRIIVPAWQEPCDIAASTLAAPSLAASMSPGTDAAIWAPGLAQAQGHDPRLAAFWSVLAPGLAATADLFATLGQPGSAYPALRAAWRRGRSIELNRG